MRRARAARQRGSEGTTTGSDNNFALWRDEFRIWIFDDPAELERLQCPKFCFIQLDSRCTAVLNLNLVHL